jgi:hypothetical protein
MAIMFRSRFPKISTAIVASGLLASSLALTAQETDKRGRKFKAPPVTARIEVTILRDFNGKPVENAAVVFHPMQGDKDKGNLELKTNEDGKTIIEVLPIGDTVRMQVIAKGFQTYGADYKVDKPEMTIEVKLKRPGEQYSIYKPHPENGDAGKDSGTKDPGAKDASPEKGTDPSSDKPADKPASPNNDAPKDKPADSSAQPTQPSQPQPN